jgi:hypothetical protein
LIALRHSSIPWILSRTTQNVSSPSTGSPVSPPRSTTRKHEARERLLICPSTCVCRKQYCDEIINSWHGTTDIEASKAFRIDIETQKGATAHVS